MYSVKFVIGIFFFLSLTDLTTSLDNNTFASTEKQLIKALLDRYAKFGRIGRPVMKTDESIDVEFGMSLIQILDVDEKNQVLETNVWLTYSWTDVLLVWNASEHDDISIVRVPSDLIWIPDIVLYNFADPRLEEKRDALVLVEPNGHIFWMPQAILRSSCSFDTTYFPFDEQYCHLKFGSWTYDGTKLDIFFYQNLTMFSLSDYIAATEWDIIENVAKKSEKFYDCCPNTPYPDLKFYLRIKRKVAFYSFILILPCSLLSLLTLVIFWVPPESPAKLVLGMNIFVAFFVLLLLLAESTPKAADSVPLIGTYFCLSMILITVSTVLSTIVANMFFRGVRINRAPSWLRKLMIDVVARLFFIRDKLIENEERNDETVRNLWSMKMASDKNCNAAEDKGVRVRLLAEKKEEFYRADLYENGQSNGDIDFSIPIRSGLAEDIRVIREIVEKYQDQKKRNEIKEKHIREWKVICCITDRLFFLLYLIINIVGVIIIFFLE
ncbi:neuronal acetylcholine receptor subunit alpha-7-like [Mytilus californianus]|uniref:neuronal acetylcholine receptor subunit alpha-7-like n=1 Tax=Mytilus californianus TaxID=6549 RepID=UPI0022461F1A|nr:neuronal acetylcholine receptor subunit alpha-7-like [Mytilus californianus]